MVEPVPRWRDRHVPPPRSCREDKKGDRNGAREPRRAERAAQRNPPRCSRGGEISALWESRAEMILVGVGLAVVSVPERGKDVCLGCAGLRAAPIWSLNVNDDV